MTGQGDMVEGTRSGASYLRHSKPVCASGSSRLVVAAMTATVFDVALAGRVVNSRAGCSMGKSISNVWPLFRRTR